VSPRLVKRGERPEQPRELPKSGPRPGEWAREFKKAREQAPGARAQFKALFKE
jgi:hypothetical protein